jgi:hypothetical protein
VAASGIASQVHRTAPHKHVPLIMSQFRGLRDCGASPAQLGSAPSFDPSRAGGMAERLKAHAWKVCIPQKGIVGSNPTPSASLRREATQGCHAEAQGALADLLQRPWPAQPRPTRAQLIVDSLPTRYRHDF